MKAPNLTTAIATTFIATLLGISGCTSQLNKPAVTAAETPLPKVEYVPGELNRETLYDLVVAEIAGQRKAFDLSLDNYLHQAQLTGDPAIAKRATYIAQYLHQADQTLLASTLWQQAEPENPEPYQIAASLLLRKGEFATALPLLRKALSHSNPQTLMVISAQTKQFSAEEAEAYIQLLEEFAADETDATLLTTLGLLYKQQGNDEQALKRFNAAIQAEPEHLEAIIQKAELLRTQNKFRQAIVILESQMEKGTADQQLYTLYVQLLFQSKQLKKGSEQAQLLVDSFPNEPQLSFYVALLLLENEQTEQSRKIMKDLLIRYPDNTTPHYYLGLVEQQEGNTELALDHFLKVRDNNNLLPAYRRIATLLDHPSDRLRLQEIIQQARNSIPEISTQLYVMEAEWLNLNDYKGTALSVLDEALQQHQDDVSLLYTRAMILEPQDIQLIERDLRRVIELEPDNSMALNALGYTLSLYTDRFDEAFELITEAFRLKPNDPAILDSMGWILLKQGKAAEAVNFLQQAYDQFPDPEVSAHLIQAYQASGQLQRAEQLLQQELLKHPGNDFLMDAATSIDKPQE
jgi:Flp pilus assembly protein TadD